MEKEAILVRIVTIVTLIYLPATFVSTFFSTDIIKYQDSDSPKGTFSPIAMERWLQVTLPLTSLTLLVAYYGNKWAESKSRGRMLPTARGVPTRDQGENSSTEEFGRTGAGYGPTTAFTKFLYYLQSDGIRRTNFEGKEFYFPRQISRWLLQKGSNATSSRVVRLFSAIYDNREGFTGKFFPTLKDKDVERDPILFAILVQMECGHMLHIFRNSIADTHLGFHNLSHLYTDIEQALKEDKITLPDRYKTTGYTGVSTDFERRRWAFHPALNVLDMVETGIEGKSILPFFDRDIINEGGTAEVHHHKIHADLVENENLRQILEPRKQDHNTGIEYYDFAVKSYLNGFDDLYKLDSDAFKRFNGTKDPRSLGVVTYLGEYLRHDRTDNGFSQGITRHIMLEFGEQDLDEYLADTYPPVLNEEIIAFWESLFEIAKTLARIHQLEHEHLSERSQPERPNGLIQPRLTHGL
ncbi:hypothetical protein CGCS363_v004313 [Colletotrichum siamense]|uniref:uncharacterized protein n=1 Tax=Colletotrichum siamense TaxID=690259 RepID=UPI0018722F8F|nr:uncharacterized protein CGCS363_v004313 [Colletotrichum siamense]KAF5505974.1 hypothetical protein CGCS363_v004313 [Colletotrichum siamense]